MRWALSRKAAADLEAIWDYTARRWNEDQAERYLRLLQNGIQTLAADPLLGGSCEELRAGYRKLLVGTHVMFYRIDRDRIEIVRILHARMDFARHL